MKRLLLILVAALALCSCRGTTWDAREGLLNAGELAPLSNPCGPTCPEAP